MKTQAALKHSDAKTWTPLRVVRNKPLLDLEDLEIIIRAELESGRAPEKPGRLYRKALTPATVLRLVGMALMSTEEDI